MDLLTHILIPYLLGRWLRLDDRVVAALVIGALAPDLDVLMAGVTWIYPSLYMLGHRAATHTLLLGSVTALIALYFFSRKNIHRHIPTWLGLDPCFDSRSIPYLFLGLLIHLFLDIITTRGVPLFYPLDTRRYSLEIFFFSEITVLLTSILILVYLAKNHAWKMPHPRLLLALILVLSLTGGARMSEKAWINDLLPGSEAYSTPLLFRWDVVQEKEGWYHIYSYQGLRGSLQKVISVPLLNSSGGLDFTLALETSRTLPQVEKLYWWSYCLAVEARYSNGTWTIRFYDPLMEIRMKDAPAFTREAFESYAQVVVKVTGENAQVLKT